MKIIFAHNPPDLYGASRSLLRLTSRLVKDGHDVFVLMPSQGRLGNELIKNGVKVILHPMLIYLRRGLLKNPFKLLAMLFLLPISTLQIIYIIKKISPDIIHTNTAVILSPAIAAFITRKTHIWHIRDCSTEFSLFWKLYRKLVSTLSSKIICVSKAVAEQFDDISKDKKISVIYNGFPAEEFDSITSERITKFKNEFQLDGKTLIGVVGRIKLGRKGQEVFIKAATILKDKYPTLHFIVIGSPFRGNEVHLYKLNSLITEYNLKDFVTVTGDVEDIKAAISALDISVLPSGLPEPFGGVVIESMALGKPVIGTNIGGTKEQIIDGESGFLIKPNDHHALSEAIEKLIRNEELRLKMGQRGKKLFYRKFEFEEFYTQLTNLYKTI